MNFFSKSKTVSTTASDASNPSSDAAPGPTGLPPDPAAMLPADPSAVPDPSAPPDLSLQPPSLPASDPILEEVPKKSRFARFKKPQLPVFRPGRKPAPAAAGDDDPALAAGLTDLSISAPPADPAKAARRAARRAARTQLENEWAEGERRRRNQAKLNNLPMEPQEPLPAFESASEDERVAKPAPPAHEPVVAEGHEPPMQAPRSPDMPFMPPRPQRYPDDPMDRPDPVLSTQQHHPASPPQQQLQPPRDPAAEAQMAEMFGAQAYTGGMGYRPMGGGGFVGEGMPSQHAPPFAQQQYAPPHAQQQYPPHGQQQAAPPQYQYPPQGAPRPAANPAPIGWGDMYNVPSQPMFGAPMHMSAAMRSVMEIDPVLADKIRRGRELARLAVEQEEQGNMGAAENGYMKALELIVPVSKELDIGSDLDQTVRMQQKSKLQREAAAMLDRCEEIRLFLKANGPPVPKEMPTIPSLNPSPPRTSVSKKKGTSRVKPSGVDADLSSDTPTKSSTAELSRPKTNEPKANGAGPPKLPPPPPPPSFGDGDSGDLLDRIASRRNVLSAASAGIHPAAGAQAPSDSKPATGGGVAKCFVCNAPANLKSKCGHTFCTKCGNQAANVFGTCPDRKCSAPLDASGFEEIL